MADLPLWWPDLMREPLLTIDPRRAGGEPCIAGSRMTAETIAWAVWNDGLPETLDDYTVTRQQALTACWWLVDGVLAIAPSRRNKAEQKLAEAWGEWRDTAVMHLGSGRFGPCPEPPEAT